MLQAIRGATTVSADTPETITEAVGELMRGLVESNGIREEDVLSVFLTVTQDLHALSPARAVRDAMGWQQTAMLVSAEPTVEGMPPRCIRVLIQFETERAREELTCLYIREAARLRPEWSR